VGLSALTATARAEAPAMTAAQAFVLGQVGVAWEPPSEAERAKAEAALLAALANAKDATVRDRIVEALGKVGAQPAQAALLPLLDGPERMRAALALASLAKLRNLGGEAARVRLERLLGDGDGDV